MGNIGGRDTNHARCGCGWSGRAFELTDDDEFKQIVAKAEQRRQAAREHRTAHEAQGPEAEVEADDDHAVSRYLDEGCPNGPGPGDYSFTVVYENTALRDELAKHAAIRERIDELERVAKSLSVGDDAAAHPTPKRPAE